jgi:uncharacterized protein
MSVAAQIAIGVVRTYQWTIRPVIGANCRFWPSCSEYAIEAFRAHGAFKGGGLTTKRILRCNPWHEGGIDLVPPRGAHSIPTPDQGPSADQILDLSGKGGPVAGRDSQTGH